MGLHGLLPEELSLFCLFASAPEAKDYASLLTALRLQTLERDSQYPTIPYENYLPLI
jgi:hypothetical protein